MQKTIKNFLENLLKAEIIANWRLPAHRHAKNTRELFEQYSIKTVLDVGANEGQYANFLRHEVGFNGTIISFEPSREQFELLHQNSGADPNWHCINLALGREKGLLKFNLMEGSQYNSVYLPRDYDHIAHRNVVVNNYEVEVETLDTMWERLSEVYNLSSIFLKMDTQGSDLQILKGAEETLSKIYAVQSELSVIPLYQEMPAYNEVIDYLCENNYALSYIHPVLQDKYMRLVECDGVFINEELINTTHQS